MHYKKEDQIKIAEIIADFVEWTRKGIVHVLPDFIDFIRTTKHSMVAFSYKEKTRHHVVLTRERLKNEIHKKENKIDLYLSDEITYDEIWLVLFVGSLNSASFELNEFEDYKMESKYNRVYLMADFDAKILQVK